MNILRLIELAACVAGFIMWRRIKGTFFQAFPFYLVFIVLAEHVGRYFKAQHMAEANYRFYSYLVIPAEFLFFFWLFYKTFTQQKKYQALPVIGVILYMGCWVADIFYIGKLHLWFYSFSYTVGNLLLLILIFRYLIWLAGSNAILDFKHDMLFWISTGLLLFYLGTFPYFGLLNTIVKNQLELATAYRYIVIILNILMYLMFTLSFLWGKPNSRYSSSWPRSS